MQKQHYLIKSVYLVKFELSPSKKDALPQWKDFKIDEKCLLFHVKSSFRY